MSRQIIPFESCFRRKNEVFSPKTALKKEYWLAKKAVGLLRQPMLTELNYRVLATQSKIVYICLQS